MPTCFPGDSSGFYESTYSNMREHLRRAALLVCFCLPCAFGQVMHVIMLTEGRTDAVPDRPFLPMARVAALWKKGHRTNTASLKQNVAYAQLRKRHQTFLQSSALCGFSPWRPCEAKGFQTISRFRVETLQQRKKKKREALHIHTRRGLTQRLLLASVFPAETLTKVTNNLPDPVIKRALKKKKNSTDDHFAQQLASSSVAIPTYACKIIKNVALNMAADWILFQATYSESIHPSGNLFNIR